MTPVFCGALLGIGLVLLAPARISGLRSAPQSWVGSRPRKDRRAQIVAVAVAAGATSGALAWLIFDSLGLVVVATVSAALVPGALTRARSASRSRSLARAWSDVVDRLVNRVRAGDSVVRALQDLQSFPVAGIAEGATIFADAVTATSDVDRSLTLLRRTWNDAVGDRVVETLRLAHDVGGAGAVTALTTLGRDVHRDLLVRSEVHARQAWIRVAMWVGLIAPWVVVTVLATRPEGRAAFSSSVGGIVLITGYVLTLAAYLVMRRVARPRSEQRVFD